MTVLHEIKSQLAKLLATEDLVVENRPVETAQFNVHTRVLTLPQWERASSTVYDLLVGHEVGHALFTPDQDPPKDIPHQFLNIVEDARIEKLMKRKYMGLAKTFYNGYRELSDEDFFCLEGENINDMNLADRTNLIFKIGNHIDIPVKNDEEQEILNIISETETFADVIVAAEILYKYCKKEKEKISDMESQPQPQQQSEGNQDESQQPQSSSEEGENNQQSQKNAEVDEQSEVKSNKSPTGGEPEVHTADSLEENLKDLINSSAFEYNYVEIPQVNLDTIIASNNAIHTYIDGFFAKHSVDRHTSNLYDDTDSKFFKFKKTSQKEVNYMVKEFECKKAADSYARATTARTGVLDCSKLHTYKYNEDLFKKVTTLADGKNHGLVFVLDWSGSMSHVLEDTCKQLFSLIWFCNKVNIPFEVYAFTCEWNKSHYNYDTGEYTTIDIRSHYEKKDGLLNVDDRFSLMNILTSKVSNKKLESQMINIWRIARYFSNSYMNYYIPDRMSLSGTPLNESLIALRQILPKFQKENNVQKVQCIILTDGEANPLSRHVEIVGNNNSYIGSRRLGSGTTFLRDRKLGTTYQISCEWNKFTDILLTNLKENFPHVNFIGIRVLLPRDVNSFIRMYVDGETQFKITQDWKKNKSFCIKNSGYDAYFGLSSTILSQETEFDVDEGATKAKIKSAFIKSLKTKKLNKKVLGEFISLVA